ncbi:MAG: GIY-YIG nuclease family protein [Bacteroidetes bacterium]|nr:MAG: GIY-YIG nuclease family protein [Bacteroidota bacterium]
MFWVYVLKSDAHYRFYVGLTEDVARRLAEHNSGRTKSTKAYRPWSIVFSESFITRTEARKREKKLKSGSGKEYIKEFWSRSSIG